MNSVGKTSTTPPIKRGEKGENSNITFYWSDNLSTNDTPYFFVNSIDGTTIDPPMVIGYLNTYRSVSVGDIIMYAESNKTREFIVKNVTTQTGSAASASVETIGVYDDINNREYDNSSDRDISININISEQPLVERFIPNSVNPKTSIFGSYNYIEGNTDTTLLKFNVVSKNGKPFGNIKITLEFYINNISPAMDSMVLNMFDHEYAQNLTSSIMNDVAYKNEIVWTKTYRGYTNAYHRGKQQHNKMYPDIRLDNYDDEKLDNFVIVLKDFGRNNNAVQLNGEETLNKNLLHQHCITHIEFPGGYDTKHEVYKDFYYKCYLFVYVPINSMAYTKKCLGEIKLPGTSEDSPYIYVDYQNNTA